MAQRLGFWHLNSGLLYRGITWVALRRGWEEEAPDFPERVWGVSQTPQVWLDLQVYEGRDGALRHQWDAVRELFPEGLVDTMSAAFDRLLATRLGVKAVDALLSGENDVMMGLQGRDIAMVPLEQVTSRQREANLDYYEMAKMLAF